MRKAIIVALLAVCLTIPVAASAFSFVDAFNYGKRIFKIGEKRPIPPVVDEKKIDRSLSVDIRYDRKEKYRVWKQAYEDGDITPIFQDKDNLVFSEEELNYFSQKEYDTASTSIVRDLKIDLVPGAIRVSGYSFARMFKGNFSGEIKLLNGVDGIYPKVVKARLGKIWIPSFFLDNMVKQETKSLKSFLYSDKDHKNLEVVIDDDRLELKYKP